MVVTVTSLQLRHWYGFFRLSLWGMRVTRQAKAHKGFVNFRNTGWGYMHYTLSQWENAEAAKAFAHSGEHLAAMKESRKLAREIKIYTYASETMPSWPEAKALVAEKGKAMTFK